MADSPAELEARIADWIRGGCPELFQHPYEDFPLLIVANVREAIDLAGWKLVEK